MSFDQALHVGVPGAALAAIPYDEAQAPQSNDLQEVVDRVNAQLQYPVFGYDRNEEKVSHVEALQGDFTLLNERLAQVSRNDLHTLFSNLLDKTFDPQNVMRYAAFKRELDPSKPAGGTAFKIERFIRKEEVVAPAPSIAIDDGSDDDEADFNDEDSSISGSYRSDDDRSSESGYESDSGILGIDGGYSPYPNGFDADQGSYVAATAEVTPLAQQLDQAERLRNYVAILNNIVGNNLFDFQEMTQDVVVNEHVYDLIRGEVNIPQVDENVLREYLDPVLAKINWQLQANVDMDRMHQLFGQLPIDQAFNWGDGDEGGNQGVALPVDLLRQPLLPEGLELPIRMEIDPILPSELLCCLPIFGIKPSIEAQDILSRQFARAEERGNVDDQIATLHKKNIYRMCSLVRGFLTIALTVSSVALTIFFAPQFLTIGLAIAGTVAGVKSLCMAYHVVRIVINFRSERVLDREE